MLNIAYNQFLKSINYVTGQTFDSDPKQHTKAGFDYCPYRHAGGFYESCLIQKYECQYIHSLVILITMRYIGCERDDPAISCYIGRITLDEMYYEKANEYFFMMCDYIYDIPVWIERGFLSYLDNKPVLNSMKKGSFKRLKIEMGLEILQIQ